MCKRILTKADLCIIFGEYSRTSSLKYTGKLRQIYFTDEALEQMNITLDRFNQIRGGRSFSYAESQRIIEYFQINKEELNEHCT